MTDSNPKREAILDAMLGLVVERGFHNAPMSELARRSGASPGVIYHYFPSKDDLIHALFERVDALKRQVLLEGYQESLAPREALMRIWFNAYRFYRKHPREKRFLDQYENSPYCTSSGIDKGHHDPAMGRVLKLLQPVKRGGVLKDLPPEAVESMTLGLAADLAGAPKTFSQATLARIADAVWAAIAEQ